MLAYPVPVVLGLEARVPSWYTSTLPTELHPQTLKEKNVKKSHTAFTKLFFSFILFYFDADSHSATQIALGLM